MNREEILQFRKKRFTKYGAFRTFGIIAGIITLLATIGGLVLACVFPMAVDLDKSLLKIIVDTFSKEDVFVNEIVYWAVYLAAVIGTAVYLLVNGIKMLSSKSKYSVNRCFGLPAWLAVVFTVFTTEQTCSVGSYITFKLFKYLYVGALVLVYAYSVVQLIETGRLWKHNGKKFVFPYLLEFIVSIAAVALCLTLVYVGDVRISVLNIWERFCSVIANQKFFEAFYTIPVIANIIDGLNALINVLLVLFFAELVSTASLLLVNFVKIFSCKNYARGSGYFSKSSVFCGAFRLALIPVLINVCTMIISLSEGQEFAFANFFYIENLALFGGVLLLGVISSAIFSTDKSNSKYEPAELLSATTVSKISCLPEQKDEKPEEEIIKIDAADKENTIEKKEEPQPDIVEEELQEEITVEELPEEQAEEETPDMADEEEEEDASEQTAKTEPPQQPFYGNVNVYPNAVPNVQYSVPMQYYNPATGQIVTYYVQQPVAQPVMQPQQFVPQGFIPCVPTGMQTPQGGVYQQMPIQGVNAQQNKPQDVFSLPKKTLNEKLGELPKLLQSYYKQMLDYACSKEDVKYNKSTFADTFYCGRDCIMKMQIKQNKIVCAFTLIDIKVREALKTDKYAKDQQTLVKIVNRASLETAKDTFEMAYRLVQEAREAHRQEQLKKRREARKSKQEGQENQ